MRRLIRWAALAGVTACASAGTPPGGAERHTPPVILKVTPDSGETNVKVKSVEFTFDEVVSDRPSGSATALDQIFLISPRDGAPNVSWHRSRIDVRPRKGFRPNQAYRVTLLPGLVDLRGNVLKDTRSIVFSTGGSFSPYRILGIVFDWNAERPAQGAYIEATLMTDTTLVYVAATDTSGRFEVGPLDPGTYRVRALMDQNSNRQLDRNEKWDSSTVAVTNYVPNVELHAIERDTMYAVFERVQVIDSVTLRATFDKPLDPALPLQPALIRVQRADSTALTVASVQWQRAYDQQRQAQIADSTRRADSVRAAATPRPATPVTPPAQVPPGARPAPPPPKPSAPPPDRGIVVHLSPSTPVVVGPTYRMTALGLRNLLGRSHEISTTFTVPRPAPRDTTRRPPADSTRRPPTDSTRRPPGTRPPR
jgi:hypothetical protein